MSKEIPHHFTQLANMVPKSYKKGEMIYDMNNHKMGQIRHIGEQAMTIRVWTHTNENLIYKTSEYIGVTHNNACRTTTGKDKKGRTTVRGPSETRGTDPSKWRLNGKLTPH